MDSIRKRALSSVVTVAMLATFALVMAPQTAMATEPDHVTVTWEGCRGSTDTYVATGDTDTPFICDETDYTSGNLGTGWAELDLVPYRLTTESTDQAPTTYDLQLTGDYFDHGTSGPGYDFITVPIVNTDLSDPSCEITASALNGKTAGSEVIYRDIQITQDPGTTCVFDVDYRLAIGASTYPGAALHAHTYNEFGDTSGIGARDVPINPKNIAPQSISKDMTASQGSDHVWNITKTPSPASLDLGDTCLAGNETPSAGVDITVEWEKLAATASGDVTIVTNIYANNPAHRDITVNVTDVIYAGTTQTTTIDTLNSGDVVVTANTDDFLVLTHTTTTDNTSTSFNDVATGSYTDTLLGVPVPGTTTATADATVQDDGPVTNATAIITDTESMTGDGLTFTVDSVTGDTTGDDSFGTDDGSVATVGPVDWTSGEQSDSGSVTFHKTVYFDGTGGDADGSLDDTATVTGSDGFVASSDPLSVDITSSSIATLTIDKSLTAPAAGDTTFTFEVTDTGTFDEFVDVTVLDGDTQGSNTLGGLEDGDYNVAETNAPSPWLPAIDQQFTVGAGDCTAGVSFEDTFGPATAQVQKVTVPAGSEDGWTFDLFIDDDATAGPSAGDTLIATVDTVDDQPINFGVDLGIEGDYYVVEHEQNGWNSDGGDSGCTFTVAYPGSADQLYSCVFTNTAQGNIIIRKVTNPATDTTTSFEFDSDYGSNFFLVGGGSNDSGNLDPGVYSVAEVNIPTNWNLTSATCDDGSPVSAIDLAAGETVTCTFNNTFTPPGSGGLTMGYWKNHLNFDRKHPTAPYTAEFLPQSLGNYVVNTTAKATAVFNAANCSNSGNPKQLNQNAIGCLAGQLLAAELNVANSGDTCITGTIATANAFLVSISYTGPTGNYSAITAQQRATAIALKTTLDQYNNGTCPV